MAVRPALPRMGHEGRPTASISGSIMGDEYTESWYYCPDCEVYTLEACRDRFCGEADQSKRPDRQGYGRCQGCTHQAVSETMEQTLSLHSASRVLRQLAGLIRTRRPEQFNNLWCDLTPSSRVCIQNVN